MDWTYCTPYKGFVHKFNSQSKIFNDMKEEKIFTQDFDFGDADSSILEFIK